MGTVPSAAGGQRRVVSVDGGPEGSQTEEKDEQDGESAAHLATMLHERWS
jgi:hypothetical protein